MARSEFTGEISKGSRKKPDHKHSTLSLEAVKAEEIVEKEMDNTGKKRKGGAQDEIQTTVPAHKNEGKPLDLLQMGTTLTDTRQLAGK